MAQTVSIRGAKEMEMVLRKLPDYIAKRVLTGAVRKGAQVVLDEARRRAPIGQESTGRVRLRKTKKGKIVVSNYGKLKLSLRLINVPAKQTQHSVTVAVSVGKAFWGLFVEFGTRFMSARPFMRPAFEAKKRQALDTIGMELGKGIEKAAVKLAGPLRKSGLKFR